MKEYKALYFSCEDGIELQRQLNNCFDNDYDFVQCIPTGDVQYRADAVVVLSRDKKEPKGKVVIKRW